MTDHITKIREALEAYPDGWENLTHSWGRDAAHEDYDDAQAVVGAVDEDGWHAGVIFVDTLNYGDPNAAKPIADFIATCHPEAIRSLLAALDEAQKDARRWKTISQEFRVMSPHIDGQHCWIFRSSDRLRGPTMEAAVDAIAAQEGGEDA